ncbi:MAG: oligosaccharide repeat unit polymerase [Bacteroidaceae bacterium]|nr:oligosaccharide repeat unit polymerase [Bacteroidaceae bacterium]
MSGFENFLILFSFIAEVSLLLYLEKKTWNSLSTPLIILAIPYCVILALSLAVSGHGEVAQFNYITILIWSAGLFIFALPSFVIGYTVKRKGFEPDAGIDFKVSYYDRMPIIIEIMGWVLVLLFAYRLKSMIASSYNMIGSDDFANEFAQNGLWGHLFRFIIAINTLLVYYVDKKHWRYIVLLVLMIAICLVYQSKSWLILPIMAGFFMRVFTGKTKLNVKFLVWILILASSFFFITYLIALSFAGDDIFGENVYEYLGNHIVHYFTSGVLGLSVDLSRGFPDRIGPELVYTQFLNIFKVLGIDSDSQLLSAFNPYYFNLGFGANVDSNVRTIFGTLFLNLPIIQFVLYILVLSTLFYLSRLIFWKGSMFNNVYTCAAYGFWCSLLFMGWFEIFFQHLATFEIPVIYMLFWCCDVLMKRKSVSVVCQ